MLTDSTLRFNFHERRGRLRRLAFDGARWRRAARAATAPRAYGPCRSPGLFTNQPASHCTGVNDGVLAGRVGIAEGEPAGCRIRRSAMVATFSSMRRRTATISARAVEAGPPQVSGWGGVSGPELRAPSAADLLLTDRDRSPLGSTGSASSPATATSPGRPPAEPVPADLPLARPADGPAAEPMVASRLKPAPRQPVQPGEASGLMRP